LVGILTVEWQARSAHPTGVLFGNLILRLVFIDAEYTGEHAYTTLVSLGLATLEGDELYLRLNDYDPDQVSDWLRANVLNMIPDEGRVNSAQAYELLAAFLSGYSSGERVHLVSAGLGSDLLLTFELFKHARPELQYFHALHCLPDYLNHTHHFDLNTLMVLAGADPDGNRDEFIGHEISGVRHDALHDARVVRLCFLKLLEHSSMARLAAAVDSKWRQYSTR
jgi:DNA polymerase III epsilon subunit-like protein